MQNAVWWVKVVLDYKNEIKRARNTMVETTNVLRKTLRVGLRVGGGGLRHFKTFVPQVNKIGVQPVSRTCGTGSVFTELKVRLAQV